MMASKTISICVAVLLLMFAASYPTCVNGRVMKSGDTLITSDSVGLGRCALTMQSDCNLVLYVLGRAVWATNTYGRGGHCQLGLTTSGQLVIANNGVTVWTSSFVGAYDKYVLVLQGNGIVVIYSSNGRSVWDTNTHASCL